METYDVAVVGAGPVGFCQPELERILAAKIADGLLRRLAGER